MADWLEEHLPCADAHRRALLRHASRTLLKQGHAPTLQAWGLGKPFERAGLAVADARGVTLGGELVLTLTLEHRAPATSRDSTQGPGKGQCRRQEPSPCPRP